MTDKERTVRALVAAIYAAKPDDTLLQGALQKIGEKAYDRVAAALHGTGLTVESFVDKLQAGR